VGKVNDDAIVSVDHSALKKAKDDAVAANIKLLENFYSFLISFALTQTTMSSRAWSRTTAVAIRFLGILLASVLCFTTTCEAVDPAGRCREAASLWLPADNDSQVRVVKWEHAIGYDIEPKGHAEIAQQIADPLQVYAREAGLTTAPASGFAIDLMVGVTPDLAVWALPRERETLESYFQDFFRKRGLQADMTLDPIQWKEAVQRAEPKCVPLNFANGGAIERSVLIVQLNEIQQCVKVGFGAVFGLTNIKEFYIAHNRNVEDDLIAVSLRALYDDRIKAGMSREEAIDKLAKICK
jgi:hypothetical protein